MDSAQPLSTDLLLRHEAFVLRLARSLVRDDAAARDLAQDTLVAALEHRPDGSRIRAWLARVLRNRAMDVGRAQLHRSQRERSVARSEREEMPGSASEQLELQHRVVGAVLALDEPYRGVVVEVYFEGLSPTEIARRRGVPAGSVRSQLSRALEQLRARLDREGGGREAWSIGLMRLLELRGQGLVAASVASVWPALLAGATVVTIAALATKWALRETPAASGVVMTAEAIAPGGSPELPQPMIEDREARQAVEAPAHAEAAPSASVADAPALLTRLRQVKRLLLERALEVDASDRARFMALDLKGRAGVIRLLDRERYGESFSLPWMREGGSYYSFSEELHDFNRRPQICLEGGLLKGCGDESIRVDLTPLGLASVPGSAAELTRALDAPNTLEWRALWRPIPQSDLASRNALAELRRREIEFAFEEGRISEAELRRLMDGRMFFGLPAQPGTTFLMRTRSQQDFDVIVALEVLSANEDGCTIAWHLLEDRPVLGRRSLWVPVMAASDLPAPTEALASSSDAELRAELERIRGAARELLFEHFPDDIEQRFGILRERQDAGLVRLISYMGPWAELCPTNHGAGVYSLADRSFQARNHDIQFEGDAGSGHLSTGFAGYDGGAVVDLGVQAFEDLTLARAQLIAGELGDYVVEHEFPRLAFDPQRPIESRLAIQRAEAPAAAEFQSRVRALGGDRRANVLVGHSYLLRAVQFGCRDLLAVLHVAALDEYGVVLAWRLLDSRAVNRCE